MSCFHQKHVVTVDIGCLVVFRLLSESDQTSLKKNKIFVCLLQKYFSTVLKGTFTQKGKKSVITCSAC